MAQLSELVSFFKRQQAPPTEVAPRESVQQRVPRGWTRGIMGSMGSRTLQARDSSAGLQRERETMNSPIFEAFLSSFKPHTPITDYLRDKGMLGG